MNIGAELTENNTYVENRRIINDKLCDRKCQLLNSSNSRLTVSDSGILKYIDMKKHADAPFDLLMHCSTFRYSEHFGNDQNAERRVCWFFNSERAPAPGFIVVMYLRAPPKLTRKGKALQPIARSSNKIKEKAASRTKEEDDESDESAPATTRRR